MVAGHFEPNSIDADPIKTCINCASEFATPSPGTHSSFWTNQATPIAWTPYPRTWCKLNTDGSALDNGGKAGAGVS